MMRAGVACRLLGCRWHFGVERTDLVWRCERCGRGGSAEYDDARTARRMADTCNRGAPGPPTGFLAALGGTLYDERRTR